MQTTANTPSGARQPATAGPKTTLCQAKERKPMTQQASNLRKHLRRFLTADPGRFAGGSAVSDPLGLLAVERERLTAGIHPQPAGPTR
jgi:hypothetical protein